MGNRKKQADNAEGSFVGRKVEKLFKGHGYFSGTVVSYNRSRGFYKVVYEDGDKEDLELHELTGILVDNLNDADAPPQNKRGRPPGNEKKGPGSKRQKCESEAQEASYGDPCEGLGSRSRRRPAVVAKNDFVKEESANGDSGKEQADGQTLRQNGKRRKRDVAEDTKNISSKSKPPGDRPRRGQKPFEESDGEESGSESMESSDFEALSSEDEESDSSEGSDVESVRVSQSKRSNEIILPDLIRLPPSSGNIPLQEDLVAEVFSVYSFLRSFSCVLFLSPFCLDDFVTALAADMPTNLIDSIHVSLLQALRRHLQRLSKEGSREAKKCLRQPDWSLLDIITWPSFLVVFLNTHGFSKLYGERLSLLGLLDSEYYQVPVKLKLAVLGFLCDQVMETDEIRAVLDTRELEWTREKDRRKPAVKGTEVPKVFVALENQAVTEGEGSLARSRLASNGSLASETKSGQEPKQADWNSDECVLCGMNGNLICCDGCPAAYHSRCVGISKSSLPPGDWFCPECIVEKVGGEECKRVEGLSGARVLGVDPYGRTFMSTCSHLLVLEPDENMHIRHKYYNKDGLAGVLQNLEALKPYCDKVLKAICQHWNISAKKSTATTCHGAQVDDLDKGIEVEAMRKIKDEVLETWPSNLCDDAVLENVCVKAEASESRAGLKESNSIACEFPQAASECVTKSTEERPSSSIDQGSNSHDILDVKCDGSHPSASDSNLKIPNDSDAKVCAINEKPLAGDDAKAPSVFALSTSVETGNPVVAIAKVENGTNSRVSSLGEIGVTTVDSSLTKQATSRNIDHGPYFTQKVYDRDSKGRFLTGVPREHPQPEQYSKSGVYYNYYISGDAAATAAANLAFINNEGTAPSQKGLKKKTGVTTVAEQVKAFQKAPVRFCWPSFKKKFMEIPKERCGWCFSCSSSSLKRGCLMNQVASHLAAGAASVAGGIRPTKAGPGHLPAVAGYLLHIEESLHSLLGGPWENVHFRKLWRKKVEQSVSVWEVKTALLELEENLRLLVFVDDWSTCFEDAPLLVVGGPAASVSSETLLKKNSSRKSTRRASASRRCFSSSSNNAIEAVQWWRRGKISHRVSGWAILPNKSAKRAGRQGGLKRVSGLSYSDGREVSKRSKQHAWRARVQAACTIAELAVQVRCLDVQLRWSDLLPMHQSSSKREEEQEESEKPSIHSKSVRDGVPFYMIDSALLKRQDSQTKNGSTESNGKEQIWVEEQLVPLSLLKDFEEKSRQSQQLKIPKMPPLPRLSVARRAKKDVFKFLTEKAGIFTTPKLVVALTCKFCSLKVPAGVAVQCHLCKGPFHRDCTIVASFPDRQEARHTCHGCLQTAIGNKSHNLTAENQHTNSFSRMKLQVHKAQNKISGAEPYASNSSMQEQETNEAKISSIHKNIAPKPQPQIFFKIPVTAVRTPMSAVRTPVTALRTPLTVAKEGVSLRKNGMDARMLDKDKILLAGQFKGELMDAPKCSLCRQLYRNDLLYIKCGFCPLWFHGDAVGVTENNIQEVVGFKCHKCRKKSGPCCPYGSKPKKVRQSSQEVVRGDDGEVIDLDSRKQTFRNSKASMTVLLHAPEKQLAQVLPATPCLPARKSSEQAGELISESHRYFESSDMLRPSFVGTAPEGLIATINPQPLLPPKECSKQYDQSEVVVGEPSVTKTAEGLENLFGEPFHHGIDGYSTETFEEVMDTLFGSDMTPVAGTSPGENACARTTISFTELLSSEDDRIEEMAQATMDFGVDGFEASDSYQDILGNFHLSPLNGNSEDCGEIFPEMECQVGEYEGAAASNRGAIVPEEREGETLCSICLENILQLDLQCITCGLGVHQQCLDQSPTGAWTDHGWVCEACNAGSVQGQEIVGDHTRLVDSRILLQS